MRSRTAADPESVGALSESLETLHVAMGHAKLYGAQHSETWRAMREALGQLEPLLDRFGMVDLESSPDGLDWQGERVHAEDEESVGLGRLLHREGIAELSLGKGLRMEELEELLDVLRVNFELPEFEEETLESMLWQAGLKRVGFRAVSTLMEAEALSGQVAASTPELGIEGTVQRIVDLRPSRLDGSGERRNFGHVSEDVLQRAIARSDLAGLGPRGGGGERFAEAAELWRRRFVKEGGRDADRIEQLRARVESERPSDLLARLAALLVRVSLDDRHELPADEAEILARQAVEEIHRQGDLLGLVRVAREGRTLLKDPDVAGDPRASRVRAFFDDAASARRIGPMLLRMDRLDADEAAEVRGLIGQLPDATLQWVLESSVSHSDPRRGESVRRALAPVVGDRVDGWLAESATQPADRVVATVTLARSLDRPGGSPERPRLLRHPSARVRKETLAWYADDLPAADLEHVLPLVADRDQSVRRAAAEALAASGQYDAAKGLRRLVQSPRFGTWEADVQRDVCIALGLVGKERSVDLLEGLLATKTRVLGTPPEVRARIEAGARGLAATGTVQGKMALKRGGGGLFGPKKKACADAIRRLEEGKPW